MSNSPLDKGRVVVVAEKYQTNQLGQNGQPVMKNRYAPVGRATLWPNDQGSASPNVEIEIDAMPIGHAGKLKMFIFWDRDNQNNQQGQQQAQNFNQQVKGQYQQNQQQQQSPTYGNAPQGGR